MIGLDTNVLVRYLVQDDPDQAARATALIEGLDDERKGFVTVVVLVELVWVLRRAYDVEPDEVHAVLDRLLRAKEVVVQHADAVRLALRRAASGADFPDALISELGAAAGCETTVTFDVQAARHSGMQPL